VHVSEHVKALLRFFYTSLSFTFVAIDCLQADNETERQYYHDLRSSGDVPLDSQAITTHLVNSFCCILFNVLFSGEFKAKFCLTKCHR
jgi:hypothetical protein